MIQTGIYSILPPIIAIVLALITKEVYSSLFLGVLSGMVIYVIVAGEPFVAIFSHIFDMMAGKIADNSYMIIFLALLWAVITLVGRSGGTAAYGRWAGRKLKTKMARRKLLSTPPLITRMRCHTFLLLNSQGWGSFPSCSVSRDSSIIPAILQ